MAMSDHLLIFTGVLATLAATGLFIEFDDRWTSVLLGYLSTALWGIMGMSAFDVQLGDSGPGEPVMAMVVIGFVLAAVTFLFASADLISGGTESVTPEATGEHLLRD